MNLTEQYDKGTCVLTKDGRYSVQMKIGGIFQVVLEKKIKNGRGTNHIPVSCLRWFSIPNMGFKISVVGDEIVFAYDNSLIIDRLRYVDFNCYLGKLFYKKKFLDYFYLTKM